LLGVTAIYYFSGTTHTYSAVFVMVRCLSVTRRYCVKANERIALVSGIEANNGLLYIYLINDKGPEGL